MDSFNLDKMQTCLVNGNAHYKMELCPGNLLELNSLVGKSLWLLYQDIINCTHCQKMTKKSFSGGYCYPCSIKLAECDICILKPELCHFANGTCREPQWGQSHCMTDHYVYLANSSGLKVGITRAGQVPTRWIDQGAVAALPILKVSTRLQSGLFEKLFATEVKDKTDWRKMLKGQNEEINLYDSRDSLFELFGEQIDSLESDLGSGQITVLEDETMVKISYPILEYPQKINSLSLEKDKKVGGVLKGIKGQYLLFDTGVINIRSHTGYKIKIEY